MIKRSTNLDKLRERAASRNQKFTTVFWRPKDPESKVRILPGQSEDEEDFYLETAYHKLGDGDNAYYNCIKYNGESCPICNKVKKLYKGSPEDVELARDIKAKKQFLFNIVLRGDEYVKDKDGNNTSEIDVKIMQVGVKIYDKIIDAIMDDEIGDITNVDNGFDLVIKRKIEGQYPNYDETKVARTSTKLFEDGEKIDYTLTHLKSFKQFVKYPTLEEVEHAFAQFNELGEVKTAFKSETKSETQPETKSETQPETKSETEPEAKTEVKAETKPETSTEFPKDAEVKKEESAKTEETPSKGDYKKWESEFESDVE